MPGLSQRQIPRCLPRRGGDSVTRKKNSSFVGSPVVDVVRDASIFSRWIGNAAGDFQLLYDRVTGENGHSGTDTIDHSGGGRGCPIALPVVSQQIDRNLRLLGANGEEDYLILVVPVFGAPGTQTHIVEVDTTQYQDDQMTAEVRDASWALVSDPVVGDRALRARAMRFAVTLGQGFQYLCVKKLLRYDDVDPNGYLNGWRMWPEWLDAGASNGITIVGSAAVGNKFPARTSLAPSSVSSQVIDDAMVATDSPLDPWVLTRLNRLVNTFWEYFTGSPTPGNETTTTTTTRNHSRVAFPSEPLLKLPFVSVGLSCIKEKNVTSKSDFVGAIGAGTPTEGPIDWVRFPQTATGTIVVTRNELWFPPFEGTAGSSDLDGRVIICDYNTGGIGGNWQARFVIGGATSAWETFVNIAGTNLYIATLNSLGFTASARNQIRLELQNTVGGAIAGQEIIVLGYGLAFNP